MGELMSGESGDETVHVRIICPHCRKQFEKTADWINANDYVRCEFCRQPIGLKAYKRKPAAAEAPGKVAAGIAKRPKPKR
jgi:DNA-directed RNA polymerase subunit RPC12/RpoP